MKETARDDRLRLEKHVYPLIGDIPITEFVGEQGLLLAEDVMRQLPADLSQPSRRQVALAKRLRRYLQKAGVDRPELFAASDTRVRLRVHDLRATFVTLALANGKTEAWVMSRTGHQSSQMLNRYRRAVDLASELALGELLPMHEIIPELAAVTITNEDEQPATTSPEQAL